MANVDILAVFRSKQYNPLEFHFEYLTIPNMYFYLTQQDIDALRYIATSARFNSKIDKKYEEIDKIMRNRGFKRFSAGTNRVVYRHLEDNRFLAKIAVDKVGMQDNPLEYHNQDLLKPFVTKMFQVSPCGTVGFSERVLPIKRKEEFREIASDVFDILVHKILGKYVVEDVGTKYFMNWGVRYGFGPVLLDYPYVYELDGNKLYCTGLDAITGCVCNGEIDYDPGFNKLVCTRCGRKYLATDLRDNKSYIKININGGNEMKVKLMNNGETVFESDGMDEFITKPKSTNNRTTNGRNKNLNFGVKLLCNGVPVMGNETKNDQELVEEVKPDTNNEEVVNDNRIINSEDSVPEVPNDSNNNANEIVAELDVSVNADGSKDNAPIVIDNDNSVADCAENLNRDDEYKTVYSCTDNKSGDTSMGIAFKRAGFMNCDNDKKQNTNSSNKNKKHGKGGCKYVRIHKTNLATN